MNVEDYETMNVEEARNSEKAKFLLASVRITDKNLLTKLNDTFALTREFYYGKILYADKQKYTIRVIKDLDTKLGQLPKRIDFSAYKKNVTVIDLGEIPIAEVVRYIGFTRNDIVKVPNYDKAQNFVKIVGNAVFFKTDKGLKTANIMDTLVVHGDTDNLFNPSSFLSQWWENNKKYLMDIKKYMMEKAKRQAEGAKRAKQQAEAAERAKQQAAEEERAKQQAEAEAERAKQQATEEEQKQREAEEAKRKAEEAKKNRLKNKRKKNKEPERRSARQKKLYPRRSARNKNKLYESDLKF